MLISIIVPIYNVKDCLSFCIESLLNQTYKKLEILLIDDGSTDGSEDICDEYSKKDKRVFSFHKKNEGLSSARNYGIDKAKGKYICFIDSDDYIDNDFIEKLYSSIIKNKSDIATSGKIIENKKGKKYINNKTNWCLENIEVLKKAFIFDEIDNSACDKLFKTSLFKNNRFPHGKYYEDIGCIFFIIENAKLISHVNDTYYHYVERSNSISKENFNEKQFDLIEMSKLVKKHFESSNNNIQFYSNSFYYTSIISVIEKIVLSKNRNLFKKQEKELKNIIKKNKKEILNSICLPFYKKTFIFLLLLFDFNIILFKIKNILKIIKGGTINA